MLLLTQYSPDRDGMPVNLHLQDENDDTALHPCDKMGRLEHASIQLNDGASTAILNNNGNDAISIIMRHRALSASRIYNEVFRCIPHFVTENE